MNGVISPEARATKRRFAPARLLVLFVAALLATVAASALWAKPKAKAKPIATNAGPRLKRELTGSLSTRDGQRLHLSPTSATFISTRVIRIRSTIASSLRPMRVQRALRNF